MSTPNSSMSLFELVLIDEVGRLGANHDQPPDCGNDANDQERLDHEYVLLDGDPHGVAAVR